MCLDTLLKSTFLEALNISPVYLEQTLIFLIPRFTSFHSFYLVLDNGMYKSFPDGSSRWVADPAVHPLLLEVTMYNMFNCSHVDTDVGLWNGGSTPSQSVSTFIAFDILMPWYPL